jgi:beta-glucosidase
VIEPGRTATAAFDLGPRAFAFWDPDADAWAVEPGRFDLLVGASSRDIRARTTLPW